MDQVMQEIRGIEDILIGWDINEYVDSDKIDYDRVYGE